jgi:hypothetical protein
MGKFLPGLFIGAAIGLLIAPKKGEEMRLELTERWKQLQNKLSGLEPETIYTNTTTDYKTDPITLPADSLESAKPTISPVNANDTSSSTFSRRSTNDTASTLDTPTSPPRTTVPNSTPIPPKPFKLNDSVENDKSAPTTPVETFEEATSNITTAPLESNTSTNASSSSKHNSPYQNTGKSRTANRWPNNNNQRKQD